MDMKCVVCKTPLKECKLRFTCPHFICNQCLGREILLKKFSFLESTKNVIIPCPCLSGKLEISYKTCLENLKESQTKLQTKILCKEHNINVINYCSDCKIWLCEECKSTFHNNYFPYHKLLSSDKMNNSKCFYHRGEIKNIFCKTCNILICKECSKEEFHINHATFSLDEYKKMVKNKSKLLKFKNYESLYYFICDKEQKFLNEFIDDITITKKKIDEALKNLQKLKDNYTSKTNEQLSNLKNIFSIIKQTYQNYYNEMTCEKIDVGSFDFLSTIKEELFNIKYKSYNKTELEKACQNLEKLNLNQFYKLKFNFRPLLYKNNQTILSQNPLTCIIELKNYKERAFLCGLNNGIIEMYKKEHNFYNKISEIEAHKDTINILTELSYQENNGFLSGSSDKTIKFWSYEEDNNLSNKKTTNRTNDTTNKENENMNLVKIKCLHIFDNIHKGKIISLLELKNGKIVSSGSDNRIKIWEINNITDFIDIRNKVSYERSLIEIDNNKLISGSSDGRIKLWDILTGELKNLFMGHTNSINCLEKISNNKIISGSSDSIIILWDLKNKKNNKKLLGHKGPIINFCYNDNQNILVSCSLDNIIKIWNMEELTCIGNITNAHNLMIYGVISFNNEIISVGNDRKIQFFIKDIDDSNFIEEGDEENYENFE